MQEGRKGMKSIVMEKGESAKERESVKKCDG